MGLWIINNYQRIKFQFTFFEKKNKYALYSVIVKFSTCSTLKELIFFLEMTKVIYVEGGLDLVSF